MKEHVVMSTCMCTNTAVTSGMLLLHFRHDFVTLFLKVTVKVALEQATKVQRWSRGIALLFL